MDADGNIVSTQACGGSYLGNTFFDDPGGTRILNFSAAGALESSSADYSDGPHGVIATQDGQSNVLSIMQVLENMGLAQTIDLNANQGGDADQLAKYGQVIEGVSTVYTNSAFKGGAIEYGQVSTNKNWHQNYYTVYKAYTFSLSVGVTVFSVNSKSGYHTTFSDWAGPVTEKGGNYGLVSITYGDSQTYTTWAIGVGPGVSIPKLGTGAYLEGTTYLIDNLFMLLQILMFRERTL
jgi:hypothetical protein